jgi:4-hydroxy-2-oxoheptanedioate aldolase
MAQSKSLRQRIIDGETLVALRGFITTTKEELADIWSTGDYDYIWIDSQHTAFDEQKFVDYCKAAEAVGAYVQLRIPHTWNAHLVGRFFDLGASAALVPEVMEEKTVEDALAYAYYPPVGRRSWGGVERYGFKAGTDRHDYAKWWNDNVVLSIQCESAEAVTNIRKLAKPGVHVVTFGPNDLLFNVEDHPGFPFRTVEDCMANVAEQLKDRKIRVAMGTPTQPEEREPYLKIGVTLFQQDAPKK